MRFWTIWTIPAMSLKERLLRTREWLAMTVAGKLPLRVRYWCAVREIARATTSSPNVLATPCDEILKSLDRPRHVA